MNFKIFARNKVDCLELSASHIEDVIQSYLSLGPEGRLKDVSIGKDRQELIMSGAAILQTLLRLWPTNKLSIADRGLREGVLFSLMHKENKS